MEVNQLLTWWNQYVLYGTMFRLHSHLGSVKSFLYMLTLSVYPLKTAH